MRTAQVPQRRRRRPYAFGEHPEEAAWAKLEAWAQPKGYLDDLARHRIFGFNDAIALNDAQGNRV